MLSVGSRNANSPWESEMVCIFLALGRVASGAGSGITTTSAFGNANPFSLKIVPFNKIYGSSAAFFLSPRAGKAKTAARIRRLILLFFLFLLLIFVLLLFVVVYVFVVFLLFILVSFDVQRIQAGDAEIGSALIAGQRVSFVQFFHVQVDYRVAVRTVDHLRFLQGTVPLYKNSRRCATLSPWLAAAW